MNVETLLYNIALASMAKEANLGIPPSMGATPNPNGVPLAPIKPPSVPMPTVPGTAAPSPAMPKM